MKLEKRQDSLAIVWRNCRLCRSAFRAWAGAVWLLLPRVLARWMKLVLGGGRLQRRRRQWGVQGLWLQAVRARGQGRDHKLLL